jgi:hypothetical protein
MAADLQATRRMLANLIALSEVVTSLDMLVHEYGIEVREHEHRLLTEEGHAIAHQSYQLRRQL